MELHRHGLADRTRDRTRPDRARRCRAACRWSPPTTASSPTPDMYEAHDALLCIAEGRLLSETGPPPRHAGALVQAGGRDARAVRRPAGGLRQHARDRAPLRGDGGNAQAAAAGLPEGARRAAPRRRRCARWRSRASSAAWTRWAPTRRRAARYRERLDYELDVIAIDGLRRLLPDRRRLHPVGEGAGHSGRPRPRLRRRLGRRLGADHHRSRSVALRPAVRALPQSRARVDAGLRHRLLPGRPRRGDRLCAPRIRRRSRGADHHLRQAAGARRGARCRPRARPAVRPGQQGRRTDPQQSGQAGHAAAGDRRRAAAAADARRGRRRRAACWRSRCRSRGCIATPPRTPPAW